MPVVRNIRPIRIDCTSADAATFRFEESLWGERRADKIFKAYTTVKKLRRHLISLGVCSLKGFHTPSADFMKRFLPTENRLNWYHALIESVTEVTLDPGKWFRRFLYLGRGGLSFEGEECGSELFSRLVTLRGGLFGLHYPEKRRDPKNPDKCVFLDDFITCCRLFTGGDKEPLEFCPGDEDADVAQLLGKARAALVRAAFCLEGDENQDKWGAPPCKEVIYALLEGCREREDQKQFLRHLAKAVIILLAEVASTFNLINDYEAGALRGMRRGFEGPSGVEMRNRLDAYLECLLPLACLTVFSSVSGNKRLMTSKPLINAAIDKASKKVQIVGLTKTLKREEEKRKVRGEPLGGARITMAGAMGDYVGAEQLEGGDGLDIQMKTLIGDLMCGDENGEAREIEEEEKLSFCGDSLGGATLSEEKIGESFAGGAACLEMMVEQKMKVMEEFMRLMLREYEIVEFSREDEQPFHVPGMIYHEIRWGAETTFDDYVDKLMKCMKDLDDLARANGSRRQDESSGLSEESQESVEKEKEGLEDVVEAECVAVVEDSIAVVQNDDVWVDEDDDTRVEHLEHDTPVVDEESQLVLGEPPLNSTFRPGRRISNRRRPRISISAIQSEERVARVLFRRSSGYAQRPIQGNESLEEILIKVIVAIKAQVNEEHVGDLEEQLLAMRHFILQSPCEEFKEEWLEFARIVLQKLLDEKIYIKYDGSVKDRVDKVISCMKYLFLVTKKEKNPENMTKRQFQEYQHCKGLTYHFMAGGSKSTKMSGRFYFKFTEFVGRERRKEFFEEILQMTIGNKAELFVTHLQTILTSVRQRVKK